MLRSVDAVTGNLPQQLSSVIGQEGTVAEVAELVRAGRLVTLTGVGGVGKTRLAVEVGAEVAGEFPDGVWLIELASVSDRDSVPAAIATVLGITPQGDTPLVETVAETLAGRQLLLVVDNCEHVLAAAASTITTILGRSGRVRIVATSRARHSRSSASRRSRSRPSRATVAWPPTRSRCSSTGLGPCGPTSGSENPRPPTR